MTECINWILDDALESPGNTSIGIATNECDYMDASQIFGDRTAQVNTTFVVVADCH